MTHYDRLIDSIKHELYEFYSSTVLWDERTAEETSHKILEIVEEFQTNRNLLNQWRASD
jgi:hypothetical protein